MFAIISAILFVVAAVVDKKPDTPLFWVWLAFAALALSFAGIFEYFGNRNRGN